jgi:hypothetical protein
LNYDTLLDDAIAAGYPTSGEVSNFQDYVQKECPWMPAKLHGFVDWAYILAISWYWGLEDSAHGDYRVDLQNVPLDVDFGEPRWVSLSRENDPTRRTVPCLRYPAIALPSDRKYGFCAPIRTKLQCESF